MRKKLHLVALVALAGMSRAEAADKADNPLPETPAVQNVIACQSVTGEQARLACFDRKVADLEAALKARQIVVSDREEVIKTRRGLFGFAVPVGRLLGLAGDEAADVKQVESAVTSVRSVPDGWVLTLGDGSVWSQNDMRSFALSPKIGNRVVIRRGAIGSYILSVDGQPGIKFTRIR